MASLLSPGQASLREELEAVIARRLAKRRDGIGLGCVSVVLQTMAEASQMELESAIYDASAAALEEAEDDSDDGDGWKGTEPAPA